MDGIKLLESMLESLKNARRVEQSDKKLDSIIQELKFASDASSSNMVTINNLFKRVLFEVKDLSDRLSSLEKILDPNTITDNLVAYNVGHNSYDGDEMMGGNKPLKISHEPSTIHISDSLMANEGAYQSFYEFIIGQSEYTTSDGRVASIHVGKFRKSLSEVDLELFNKVYKHLKDQGIISIESRSIKITDQTGLEKYFDNFGVELETTLDAKVLKYIKENPDTTANKVYEAFPNTDRDELKPILRGFEKEGLIEYHHNVVKLKK